MTVVLQEERDNKKIADRLIKLLGKGWWIQAVYPAWINLRHGEDDAALMVGHDRGRGLTISTTHRTMYKVSPLWPHGAESNEYKPEGDHLIGVSKSRGLEALASEIQRRLLTTYFEEYAKQLALAKESLVLAESRRRHFTKLLAIVHDKPTGQRIHTLQACIFKHQVKELYLRPDGTVDLDFYALPSEVAIEMLQLVAKRLPK